MAAKLTWIRIIIPIFLSFFVMGMVDIVGVSTNFAKIDFGLSDFTASVLPMMVFLWFAIFSIPTCLLMNRIGRKNTVLLAICIGTVALLLPLLVYSFAFFILVLALLGISNSLLQVSLNPFVASFIQPDRLASTLTFGQFVKAIASFLGPILTSIAVRQYGDWKLVFAVYALSSLIAFACLYFTPIPVQDKERPMDQAPSFTAVLGMLKDSMILRLFLGIVVIVGIDVCMNTNIPQLLTQKLNMSAGTAGLGSSVYFGARTLGAFLGAMLLIKLNASRFLRLTMLFSVVGFLLLMFSKDQTLIYSGIILVGLTCANVFSILFSFALQYRPNQTNEISSLMIMGVAGGAIITPMVGLTALSFGMDLSFGVLLLGAGYLLVLSLKFSN